MQSLQPLVISFDIAAFFEDLGFAIWWNFNRVRINVFKRASLCRNFELYVLNGIRKGVFKFPIYLSGGQEYISASIAEAMKEKKIDPHIFIQHRGHSTYLSFDASIPSLMY